jgi:thiol-disulfide isomerase/thioredoxin
MKGLCALAIAGILSPGAQPLKIGAVAPDVTFATASGGTVSIASLRGKVVLVDFWASWCGPCKVSFPAIDKLHQALAAKGLYVLAVNVDERRRDADRFLDGRPHEMGVVFDPEGKGPAAFRVSGMPSSYLLGRDGRLRFVHEGYTEKTLGDYRREIEQLLAEPADRSER